MKWHLIVIFICNFLANNEVEHLFMYNWPSVQLLRLLKCLFKSLALPSFMKDNFVWDTILYLQLILAHRIYCSFLLAFTGAIEESVASVIFISFYIISFSLWLLLRYCLCFWCSAVPRWYVSVQLSRSAVSDSLRAHALHHARLPCPSPTPKICSNSCPSNWGCHPTISSLLSPSPSAFNLFQCRVFSNESVFPISWPKYWSFNFSINPLFRTDVL